MSDSSSEVRLYVLLCAVRERTHYSSMSESCLIRVDVLFLLCISVSSLARRDDPTILLHSILDLILLKLDHPRFHEV